jgi:hypothetical protein
MLRTLRHLYEQVYDQGLHWKAFERTRAALYASTLARKLARNREAVSETLGWCGWAVGACIVLIASWELGGFAVLVSQEPMLRPPAFREAARAAPAQGQAGGCTQASLDRTTGLTTPSSCRPAGSGE